MPRVQRTVVVSAHRGQLILKKWPRPRGTPKSQAVRAQNAFFAKARQMSKMVDPSQLDAAIKLAKGSGLYPNDLIMSAMMRGLYVFNKANGRQLQPFNYKLEVCTMQGARLAKTAAQAVAAATNTVMTWGAASLNNALMWDPAQPTRLTVPTGVQIIELYAAIGVTAAAAHHAQVWINKNGATNIAQQSVNDTQLSFIQVSSGPLVVVAGDYFECLTLSGLAGTVNVDARNYFAAQILQAA
jgi:hypothetical protein